LGQEQQQLGLAGLKTMSDYGAQQQSQGQKLLDYPMAQTQQFAKLLQGYQMPMGTTTQATGSEGYSNSPLSQIAGLGSLVASLFPSDSNAGLREAQIAASEADAAYKRSMTKAKGGVIRKASGGGVHLADGGMAPSGAEYHDGNGNFYDADGYLLG
jgi:hypothetical protein